MSVLASILKRATPENPSFNLNDPEAWDALGAHKSSTGVRVNLKSALTLSTFRRGLNLISNYVAKLPVHVYKRQGDGKVRDTEHFAYALLRWKPNREMHAFDFMHTMTWHGVLGNSYAYIFRRGDASPEELIPLSCASTYPVRENGRLWYVTTAKGEMRKLLPENVLHIKGMSDDGMVGMELIPQAKDSLGLTIAAREYPARFFSNSAEARIVLEHPAKLSPEAAKALREGWDKMHQGLENAHKTAVLMEGMKANRISANAKEAQLVEMSKFQVRDMANWLDLPPHKLGDDSRTAFASLEQENQSLLDDGIDPWLVRFEHEFRDKLLTEEQKRTDTHVIEFMRHALVRADIAARFQAYAIAINNRIMNPNEVRSRENLNPYDGGDEFLVPANMGNPGGNPDTVAKPAKKTDQSQEQIDDDEEDADRAAQIDQAQVAMLRDAVARMAKRLGTQARRAAKTPGKFIGWLESCHESNSNVVREALAPAVQAICLSRKVNVLMDSVVDALILDARKRFNAAIEESDAGKLPELVDRCASDMEESMPKVAERFIAHQEAK